MALRRAIGFVFLLAISAATVSCARGPTLLKGTQGTYEVPSVYIKSTPSGYGDPSKYDTSFMLSLAIPFADTVLRAEKQGDALTVQLFADKRYELALFTRVAKSCLAEAVRQKKEVPFFVYRKSDKWGTNTCYFTFDPETLPPTLTQGDYYVRASQDVPFKIADTSTTPRGSCTLTFIRDGILIDVGAIGALCTPEAFPQMILSLDRLLDRWRQK
jgi:hypothetical protein